MSSIWSCEETAPPEEEGWETLYKVVPTTPDEDQCPEFKPGFLYWRDKRSPNREIEFHASHCYALCQRPDPPESPLRFLKVQLRVMGEEDSLGRKWGDRIYILEEQSYEEMKTTVVVCRTRDGTIFHTRGLSYHREEKDERGDTLPAVIRTDGAKFWYSNGRIHRGLDEHYMALPAVVQANGAREWWEHGHRHMICRDKQGFVLPAVIMADGTQKWYKNNMLHRDDVHHRALTTDPICTLPAIIWADGTQEWWKNGYRHRDDQENGLTLPAVVRADGTQEWYLNGKRHRQDVHRRSTIADPICTSPAIIRADGTQEWWRDGGCHRVNRDENGLVLPAVIRADGTLEWWKDGMRHRDDQENGLTLPAVVQPDGTRKWYRNGRIHRDDRDENGGLLPAIIRADGTFERWKDGVKFG